MILPDVNVLVYAHRVDAEGHARYRRWLEEALDGPSPVGMSDLVLAGVGCRAWKTVTLHIL